ncbi:hypothetical protein BDY17DRAFT_32302 [Neohortaea acidophila]|uniref:Uncharacterized protein n=1 Tax=Neohortaea acidophila TaxID=245834 RepID=A0A6A6PJ92_9PEZI|nr:uncharacterized protein BDY17DRAFT_32302 [Neohortaea acidophila]KAF2480110.1 hypothetical protein BDY17DRAFT_32302 [Neohortaea acidophila]
MNIHLGCRRGSSLLATIGKRHAELHVQHRTRRLEDDSVATRHNHQVFNKIFHSRNHKALSLEEQRAMIGQYFAAAISVFPESQPACDGVQPRSHHTVHERGS